MGVLPRPPPGRLRRPGEAVSHDVLITRRHRRRPDRRLRRPTCWSTARRSPRSTRPDRFDPAHADRVVDATGKYVIPGGDRRAHAHGAAVRRHVRERHVRDRHAGRGVRRHDHDHRLRGPAHRRGACRTGWPPGTQKADGKCSIDYALPHDPRRRRRRRRSRRWTSSSTTRASPASSCSWPTRACSTATTARSCGRCRRPATTAR